MARKKNDPKQGSAAKRAEDDKKYDLDTPLWSRYYKELRKRMRFPRHYKKALNW